MFAKLLVLILAAGTTAAGLLVMRQQRLEIANEMVVLIRRAREHEQALWELRNAAASQCRPALVRELMQALPTDWSAIAPRPPVEPPAPPTRSPAEVTASGAREEPLGG